MPGIVGFQETWLVGSRLYFKRDDEGTTEYPTLDLGTITQTTPNFEPTIIQARDPDGGRLNLIDEGFTEINESYEVTCLNINMENLNILYYGNGVENLFPIVGQYTNSNVSHNIEIGPGKLVKLFSSILATGETELKAAYNINTDPSTFTAKKNTSGGATLTKYDGTNAATADYEIVSFTRGLVRFFSTGTNSLTESDVAVISFKEDTNGPDRLVKPQTSTAPLKGKAYIVFSRNNNTRQSVRECDVSLQVNSANFQIEDYSSVIFNVAVLTDIQNDDVAGRYIHITGDEISNPGPGQGNIG